MSIYIACPVLDWDITAGRLLGRISCLPHSLSKCLFQEPNMQTFWLFWLTIHFVLSAYQESNVLHFKFLDDSTRKLNPGQ